ncbi:MAG: FAD-binding domain-containing protein [Rhodoferax sp.]|nr:FAD-binding domain-containing protein [Rhodoferax sp.]
MSYSVVWFKRDLRTQDHAALQQALQAGPVLCLYCIEPTLWAQADASTQHYQFLLECLRDTWVQLKRQGVRLPWLAAPVPRAAALGLTQPDKPLRQRGGTHQAREVLQSFLMHRSARYRGGISSPLSASEACSRLSPYLALGCLSVREVAQAAQQAQARSSAERQHHQAGLRAFVSRLHWHCHFIQKLESEPGIEFCNMHRGYDGLREPQHNPAHLAALMEGRTGWPLVDACVAMLRDTGWLNFRMRAMLVSVAAYPLWLHWRPVGVWLAQEFLDYEPGIHWSQLQMQSGTTGINVARIYNPIKQARDQDPQGHFVRRWLPALRKVPDAWLLEPWRMPLEMQARLGLRVDGPVPDIAQPLVDLDRATRIAKQRLFALRAQPEVRAAKADIVQKHGSRTFRTAHGPTLRPGPAPAQLELL